MNLGLSVWFIMLWILGLGLPSSRTPLKLVVLVHLRPQSDHHAGAQSEQKAIGMILESKRLSEIASGKANQGRVAGTSIGLLTPPASLL